MPGDYTTESWKYESPHNSTSSPLSFSHSGGFAEEKKGGWGVT